MTCQQTPVQDVHESEQDWKKNATNTINHMTQGKLAARFIEQRLRYTPWYHN